MLKPLIAMASLLVSAAAVAAVAYIQFDPLAFTSREGRAIEAPEIHRSFEPTLFGVVVSLPPDQAERPLIKRYRPRMLATPEQAAPKPCSPWRDLGPKAVAHGSVEERHVRLLCQ